MCQFYVINGYWKVQNWETSVWYTHPSPQNWNFLNWSDFLGNLKLEKYRKFPGIYYIRGKAQFDQSVY